MNDHDERLWHGGVPGLKVGDLLLPGKERRQHPGCEICAARARGESSIDPASAKLAVYVTKSKSYARYYASLCGYGDLYVVEPVGEIERSPEDHFPAWTCASARIVSVYQRAIQLKWSQRRALWREWEKMDRLASFMAEVRR